MFDALNVELQEIYLVCIHMYVEINNNTFKLLCGYIVILNPIKIQLNLIWIQAPQNLRVSFYQIHLDCSFIKLINYNQHITQLQIIYLPCQPMRVMSILTSFFKVLKDLRVFNIMYNTIINCENSKHVIPMRNDAKFSFLANLMYSKFVFACTQVF